MVLLLGHSRMGRVETNQKTWSSRDELVSALLVITYFHLLSFGDSET
jgi:hypothetical protein